MASAVYSEPPGERDIYLVLTLGTSVAERVLEIYSDLIDGGLAIQALVACDVCRLKDENH